MSAPAPLALVQGVYAAFGRGDAAAIVAAMSPEIVWESRYPAGVPLGGVFRGHAGVRDLLGAFDDGVEVLQFQPREWIAAAENVVVLGFEEARARPTGRAYRNEWAHVWTVRDGQVVAMRTYNDTAAVGAAFA
jgi:ketosteroid isomerase-like protein